MRRALLVVTIALLTGCAIQPDAGPRDIPADDRIPIDPVPPDAGATAGSSRVFFLTGADVNGEQSLRAVSRSVDPPTPQAVLDELFNGPNEQDLESGFRTALPDTVALISARSAAGTLNVDVSPAILELPVPELRLAIAEIVFTANELAGVREVRITVDGEPQAWPDGRGELQTEPLTVYDYPGLAETTQPPFPAVPSEQVT